MIADHFPSRERYGDTWIQHPDGLYYYGPRWPSQDAQLGLLERDGKIGHVSVRRGESRDFLRFHEADDPR